MDEDKNEMLCFQRAEGEVLSAIQWLEGCRNTHVMDYLSCSHLDKMKVVELACYALANINKLRTMYVSLFYLSKTYNHCYASYVGKDRLAQVLKNFESMKDTLTYLKDCLPCQMKETIDLPQMTDDNKPVNEPLICIDEPECNTPNIFFERNYLSVIQRLDTYSEAEVIVSFLGVVSELFKTVLSTLMLCKTIIQEEQEMEKSPEMLEKIYQQSLHDVWESLKMVLGDFNEEKFEDDIKEAERFSADKAKLLPLCFHHWSKEHFTKHAIAMHMLKMKQARLTCGEMDGLQLFPDDPQKNQIAIWAAEELDYIIQKTRKVAHCDKRIFATRFLVVLSEQLGFHGGKSTLVAFLKEHYPGEHGFPDISAFSVDSKMQFRLESESKTIDGAEKMRKQKKEAEKQGDRLNEVIARKQMHPVIPLTAAS